jgi:CRISPR-associated protein Cmr2
VTRVKGNQRIYDSLPYDGQLLYPFRLRAELNRLDEEPDDSASEQDRAGAIERLKALDQALGPLLKKFREPSPYLAVVHADGDRMGELLDGMTTPEQHRQVSQALADFAQGVPVIVRQHWGHCIYYCMTVLVKN